MEVPAGLYDILWGQGAWLQVPDKRDFVQRWSGCLAEGRSNRLRTRLSRATGERGARGEAGAGEGAGGARVLLAGPAHKPTGLARPIRSRWLDRRAAGRSHSDSLITTPDSQSLPSPHSRAAYRQQKAKAGQGRETVPMLASSPTCAWSPKNQPDRRSPTACGRARRRCPSPPSPAAASPCRRGACGRGCGRR